LHIFPPLRQARLTISWAPMTNLRCRRLINVCTAPSLPPASPRPDGSPATCIMCIMCLLPCSASQSRRHRRSSAHPEPAKAARPLTRSRHLGRPTQREPFFSIAQKPDCFFFQRGRPGCPLRGSIIKQGLVNGIKQPPRPWHAPARPLLSCIPPCQRLPSVSVHKHNCTGRQVIQHESKNPVYHGRPSPVFRA
jgi:hypothetical protein